MIGTKMFRGNIFAQKSVGSPWCGWCASGDALTLHLILDLPVSSLEWRGEVGAEKPLQTHMRLFFSGHLPVAFVFFNVSDFF